MERLLNVLIVAGILFYLSPEAFLQTMIFFIIGIEIALALIKTLRRKSWLMKGQK